MFFILLYNITIVLLGGEGLEHWEFLKPDGLQFVYDDTLFRPGTDTFLLSSFPRLKSRLRVCDLGSGTGLLSLLLLQRHPALSVTGIEIQEAAVSLAQKAIAVNHLEEQLSFFHQDLRTVKSTFPSGSFDLVVCNPPYYPPKSGFIAADQAISTARSETDCSLEDVCRAAAYLLRWGGDFCVVHKPERLTDLLCTMRTVGLEPKRMRFICKSAPSAPSLVLIEARRGGKSGLIIEPPLILQTEHGAPTPEVDAIYFRTLEDTP